MKEVIVMKQEERLDFLIKELLKENNMDNMEISDNINISKDCEKFQETDRKHNKSYFQLI